MTRAERAAAAMAKGWGAAVTGRFGGHPRKGEESELEEGEGDEESAREEERPGGEEAEEEEGDDVGALVEQGAEGVEHERQPEGEREGEPGEGEGVAGEGERRTEDGGQEAGDGGQGTGDGGRRAERFEVEDEEDGEGGGAENPGRGGAEGMEDFFAAAAGDGFTVAGREEMAPLAEEDDFEIGAAGGEGLSPALRFVVGDEGFEDAAGVGRDGAGEVPFDETVAGRFVEALVGEPREGEDDEDEGGGEEVPPGEREGGKPRAERTVHLRSFPAEKREEDDERGEGEEGEHHAAVGEGAEGGEGPAGKPAVARVEGGLGREEGAEGEEDEGGAGEFRPDEDRVEEEPAGEDEGGGGGVRVAFGEAEPAEEDPEGGNPEELKPDAGGGAGFVVADVEGAEGGEGDEGEAGLERGAVAAQPVTAGGFG
jgi:hypothetical protein